MSEYYSKTDSDLVRKTYFGARRKESTKDVRKYLISKSEWAKLKAAGSDMSRYEIYTEFLSRARKADAQKRMDTYKTLRHVSGIALNVLKKIEKSNK
jgi:hypothetical protein